MNVRRIAMKRAVFSATLWSCALLPGVVAADRATAQTGTIHNEQLEIVYGAPADPRFAPIRDRLTRLQVLEQFSAFMAPLRLSRKLVVAIEQCNAEARHYQPQGQVTVCYELIERIEGIAAKAPGRARENIILGTFIQ